MATVLVQSECLTAYDDLAVVSRPLKRVFEKSKSVSGYT
jgi:hypothetical protein